MDESGKVVRRPTGEKGTLLEKMARARGQLDEFVEQTAEQFRKMKVRFDDKRGVEEFSWKNKVLLSVLL